MTLTKTNNTESAIINLTLVNDIYRQLNSLHFDDQLPECKIELSTRLKRTAGKIWPKQRLIRLSIPYHNHYGLTEINNTLLHEMIHLWLYLQGLPSGHTPVFRQKLAELGIPDRIHALPMPPSPYKYLYSCPTCHREIQTHKRINSSCGKCDKVYNPKHQFFLLKEINFSQRSSKSPH